LQIYWHCRTSFASESCSTAQELYPDPSHDLFEAIEDPVNRWKKLVEMYSGLKLTFASDRLPAIAALVERELRVRQGDTYIAGMWISSLLDDLTWRTVCHGDPLPPRPPTYVPTWTWPSSQAPVSFSNSVRLPALRLVDLSFVRVGPAHIGDVKDARITLRGPDLAVRLPTLQMKDMWNLASCLEIASPPCLTVHVSKTRSSPDFNWTSGDRPVNAGDTFSVILTIIEGTYRTGIILREVTENVFERMGLLSIRHIDDTVDSCLEETQHQWLDDYVDSLPIRDVKII
jgi:hypothetical protein